jgi:hypothetical protein
MVWLPGVAARLRIDHIVSAGGREDVIAALPGSRVE